MGKKCLFCGKENVKKRFVCRCKSNHMICKTCSDGKKLDYDDAVSRYFGPEHNVTDLETGVSQFALFFDAKRRERERTEKILNGTKIQIGGENYYLINQESVNVMKEEKVLVETFVSPWFLFEPGKENMVGRNCTILTAIEFDPPENGPIEIEIEMNRILFFKGTIDGKIKIPFIMNTSSCVYVRIQFNVSRPVNVRFHGECCNMFAEEVFIMNNFYNEQVNLLSRDGICGRITPLKTMSFSELLVEKE